MRNLKKVLALVIAFSMMLSVVAFAGYNDVDADADYAGAVELLSALDIIKGDDQGNFNPDNTITRAEMAAIICRAKGLEDAATGAMGPTAFTDVAADHWAAGYVNLASQNGIINGYGDGRFGPEDTVTYEQAIKMIVCALGFEPMAAAKGGWPTGYLVVANSYKVTAGASVNATRANIAIIVANAMNTPMMDQTSFGSDAKFEVLDDEDNYRTLLTDMDIYVATGIVGAKDVDKVAFTVKEVSDDFMFQTVDKSYDFVIGDTNILEYQNQMVDAYVKEIGRNKFEVVAVAPAAISETLVLISDVNEVTVEIDADTKKETGVITYFPTGSSKEKEIEVDTAAFTIEYNKVAQSKDTKLSDIIDGTPDIELTFINNDDDSEFDALVAIQYTSTRVEYVEADRNKIGFDTKISTLDFEDENKTIILRDADGKELTLADFAEDDVIAVLMSDTTVAKSDYVEIVKLTNATVTGTVETTWTDGGVAYVSIDGKEYVNDAATLEPGDEGTFFLGMTGKIIDFEGTTTAGNYGYILEAAQTTEFSKTVWQVRMLTAADGVVVFDVDEDAVTDLETILGTLASKKVEDSKVVSAGYVRNEDADKRLVEYEVDGKGNIDEIKACDVTLTSGLKEYKAETQRIDSKTLADDVVVMYVDKANAEDVYTTDISFLVDEAQYAGAIVKNADKEYVVMVVTATDSPFRAENGFAIVTRVSTAKNAEGQAVTKVDYVQGEVEGSVIFDKESEKAAYGDDYDDLKLGSVFLFNADADGVVTSYAVIAQYTGGDFVLAKKEGEGAYDVAADYAANKYGEDYEIATGYLYHRNPKSKKVAYIAKSKTVASDSDVVEVTLGGYKYTYDDTIVSKKKIEIGDFLATEGTEYWSVAENDTKATPVIYVTCDGAIVDIYTANAKVDIKDEKGNTTFKKLATIIEEK